MLRKATEQDRTTIIDYCLAEPNINIFILGDIENFGFACEYMDVWLQYFEGKITGIVLRYHENLILYSQPPDKQTPAMDFQEVKLLLQERKINVISGKGTVIDGFYPLVADRFSKRQMYFSELTDNRVLKTDTREVVLAEEKDVPEIAEAYGLIKEFAGLYAADVRNRKAQILSRIRSGEGIHMFIRKEGKIVSHGNTTAETGVSGMIGGIFTLPEYRGQGLAGKVISTLCNNLAKRGKSACLFYDNSDAGRIYRRLGFHDTGRWTVLEKKTLL